MLPPGRANRTENVYNERFLCYFQEVFESDVCTSAQLRLTITRKTGTTFYSECDIWLETELYSLQRNVFATCWTVSDCKRILTVLASYEMISPICHVLYVVCEKCRDHSNYSSAIYTSPLSSRIISIRLSCACHFTELIYVHFFKKCRTYLPPRWCLPQWSTLDQTPAAPQMILRWPS